MPDEIYLPAKDVATAGPASAAASVYQDEGCETFGAFEFCYDVKSVFNVTETPSGNYNLIDNGKFSYTHSENGSAARSTPADVGSSMSPGADLKPTNIKFDRWAAVAGSSVLLDSGVSNLGETGTGVFNIKWFVDGQEVAYGSHGGVPGKAQVLDGNTQIDYTFAEPGCHSVTFVVDVDNHVAESNEDNNSRTVKVKVTGADLKPTNIKFDRSAAVAGSSVLLGLRRQQPG